MSDEPRGKVAWVPGRWWETPWAQQEHRHSELGVGMGQRCEEGHEGVGREAVDTAYHNPCCVKAAAR